MEHHNGLTSDLTMFDLNNNSHQHYHHHHNRRKTRTKKQQQLQPLTSSKKTQIKSVSYTDPNNTTVKTRQRSMKAPCSWKQRWSQWFSLCGSERVCEVKSIPIAISIERRARTKSENDLAKRASAEQDEKKNLTTTNSTLVVGPNSNDNQERNLSKTSAHQHHHHQPIDKVNNSNSVIYRDTSRRYSNSFFSPTRYGGGGGGGVGQHQSRTSIAAQLSPTNTHPKQHLSRSADRLNSKSARRELRYEEHNDYIPPPLSPPPIPLNSIQCHPTIDHYARTLNQSSYFYSTHRRSQIEVYQLTSPNKHTILPRPYSSNFPLTTYTKNIPIQYSSTIDNIQTMSQTSPDNNETYGRLSECHSPLTPVENSSVKAPRRIEPTYNQFPTVPQEPVYANTQSLYDNILYPESSTAVTSKLLKIEQEKKSCASQTQLTWTMATFSSFVDLENQSIIIQQPDPATFHSIVRHHQTELPPSASPATIEHIKRTSPSLQFIDDNIPSRPRTPTPTKTLMVEKRDGSFQTLLTIAPTQEIDPNKQILRHDSTPSPLSTGSSSNTDQQHHHHHHHHRHHRRHKSRNGRSNVSTRDVGLQVSIQTVKKITFSSEKSDESSMTTSTSSPPTTVKSTREFKHIQTNTEPELIKHDRSTSYESNIHLVTSSSQTLDSPIESDHQTKAAQTPMKSLRDQSIGTDNQGLFVCDLSSFLKNGLADQSSSPITKQKS